MIKLQDSKGKIIEHEVWYDWKPRFCQKYLQVGHSCVEKAMGPTPKKRQEQEAKKIQKATSQEGNTQDKGNIITNVKEKEDGVRAEQQAEYGKDDWQVVKRKGTRQDTGQSHNSLNVAEIEQCRHSYEVGEQSREAGRGVSVTPLEAQIKQMIVTWNVRGLNKEVKQKEIRLFIRRNKVQLLTIFEHRVRNDRASKVVNKLMPGWDNCTNAAVNLRVKIQVIWNPDEINFVKQEATSQHVHA